MSDRPRDNFRIGCLSPSRRALAQLLSQPATQPGIMAILNVTPDSFSDGGQFLEPQAAARGALQMVSQGANWIDIGPESTRPGSVPVPESQQMARVLPVIQRIRQTDPAVPISIDTRSAAVAQAALEAGADAVNDVSAMRDDPRMMEVVARSGAAVILMHRRGDSTNMQAGGGPRYDDVVSEVVSFLLERQEAALGAGILLGNILLDPGLGFGKRFEHNLILLKSLRRFLALGRPVVLGASRKSFIGTAAGIEHPADRLAGSLACAALAVWETPLGGPPLILRVHDVAETVQAVKVCSAVRSAEIESIRQ
jgi:dihydropteroate synthase